MDLTIIILNFNTKNLLQNCLKSILDKSWKYKIEVLVVDNASDDNSVTMVRKNFPRVQIIESKKNLGFAGGNNLGLKKSQARYSLLLNSDTEVLEKSLDNLITFMDKTDFGIGSCKLLNKDRSFQPNAGDLPFGLSLFSWLLGLDDLPFVSKKNLPSFHQKHEDYYKDNKEVGWVSGSVMIIKKEVLDKIGFLDEAIFMYGEDADFCFRAQKAGFKAGWTNSAQIIHLGGGSLKRATFSQWVGEFRGLIYFYKKYFGERPAFFLKILIYVFTFLRIIAFLVVGKPKISKVYAEVLVNL